jgi:NAD(P)-dependent dehydrogenase (short-subunit alcohol dehydrogenase family)
MSDIEQEAADGTSAHPVHVVFGATGGIGSELCRHLANRGARLVVASRDADKVESLANDLGAHPFTLDATRSEEVDRCIEDTVSHYGRLDGVANCVGSLLLKPAHVTTDAEWEATLSTNLGSAFAVVRAAARAMMRTGGSIVLVSTAAARIGIANHEAIAAAKAGILGLTLAAAASYAGRQIRVNAVAPGLVETPLSARITQNEASRKASEAMHALGRLGQPVDVAALMAWLLDPTHEWVTGQVFGVDGGLATLRSR